MQPLHQDSEVKGHSLDLITLQCNLKQKVKQIFNCLFVKQAHLP